VEAEGRRVRVHLGSDHAGFELKESVEAHLVAAGHDVVDVGPAGTDPVDYPDFAAPVARAVSSGEADVGVLVCGSGIGMAMAANKVDGVRAVQARDEESARMARLHNDANVLTLAGRYTESVEALAIVDAFLATEFEGGRHQRRVDKIGALEAPDRQAAE
jgi:ribose 5-phosphate isomerase B